MKKYWSCSCVLVTWCLFLSSGVFAEDFFPFHTLFKKFKSSSRTEINRLEETRESFDYIYQAHRYPWNISFDLNQEQNDLASLFSFQAQLTSTQTAAMTLSKRTFEWGEFEFAHTQRTIDVSQWDQRGFLPSDSDLFYEMRNSFNYRFDFWDRSLKIEKEIIDLNLQRNNERLTLEQQKQDWEFYQAYIKAKNDWFRYKLSLEIQKKSQLRLERISKRVQDGLSRSVEKLLAQNVLLQQKDQTLNLEKTFQLSLNSLEVAIGNKVDREYFEKLTWNKFSYENFQNLRTTEIKENNRQIHFEQLLAMIQDKENQRRLATDGMKLQFNAGLVSNSFQDRYSQAYQGSVDLSENTNKVLGLRLIIPLGGDRANVGEQIRQIDKNRQELTIKNLLDDLKVRRKNLAHELSVIDQTYNYIKEKTVISLAIVQEQNKLYERGLISFEEVLRAEEALVNDQINEKNILSLYDLFFGELALIHDQLPHFLNRYEG